MVKDSDKIGGIFSVFSLLPNKIYFSCAAFWLSVLFLERFRCHENFQTQERLKAIKDLLRFCRARQRHTHTRSNRWLPVNEKLRVYMILSFEKKLKQNGMTKRNDSNGWTSCKSMKTTHTVGFSLSRLAPPKDMFRCCFHFNDGRNGCVFSAGFPLYLSLFVVNLHDRWNSIGRVDEKQRFREWFSWLTKSRFDWNQLWCKMRNYRNNKILTKNLSNVPACAHTLRLESDRRNEMIGERKSERGERRKFCFNIGVIPIHFDE